MSFDHLVVIETQKVKSYVFGTPKLREMRGASLLLDSLNLVAVRDQADALEKAGQCKVVYIGGGSGRIRFADLGEAKQFCRDVRALYRDRTAIAKVAAEVVTRVDDEPLLDLLRRGVRETQKQKLSALGVEDLLGGRWIRPCTSCGQWPAEKEMNDVQGHHRLCRSCLLKRNAIALQYATDKGHGQEYLVLQRGEGRPTARPNEQSHAFPENILPRFLGKIGEAPDGLPVCLPQDIGQIADRSHPANYVGLIYADGNAMGEAIKKLVVAGTTDTDAAKAYRAFSNIVDEATKRSAVDAVLRQIHPVEVKLKKRGRGRFYPVEFVMAGGDDLILLVPGHTALEIAADFLDGYQSLTRDLQNGAVHAGELTSPFAPSGLTSSAGVVIAHGTFPASQLVEIAGVLMKLAKRRAAKLPGDCPPIGTLDFMVLHSPGLDDVKHWREEYEFDNGDTRMTRRPYTTEELRGLLDRIRCLKNADLPRAKLKALYPALFEGRLQAQYEALRIRERLTSTLRHREHREVAAFREWLEGEHFPFRRGPDGKLATDLSELVEIYDFVQPQLQGGGATATEAGTATATPQGVAE